jgi:predicted ester cyclase
MENATEKIKKNKAIVRDAIEAINDGNNMAAIEKHYASDYVHRSTSGPEVYGPEGVKALIEQRRVLLPNATIRIEEQVAEGDKVVTRWTMRVAHQEDSVKGISVDTIANEQITESWAAPGVHPTGINLPNSDLRRGIRSR